MFAVALTIAPHAAAFRPRPVSNLIRNNPPGYFTLYMPPMASKRADDGETFDESAIDERFVATTVASRETDDVPRAGLIALDDIGAPVPPPLPLAVTTSREGNDVVLRWSPDPAPLFFTIERRNSAGVFCEIAVVPALSTEARVNFVDGATYRVRAWNSAGPSH